MVDENNHHRDANPYASTRPDLANTDGKSKAKLIGGVPLMGALWSVVSAFPVAGVIALLFRFPVPLAGYQSGVNAVIPAMIGVGIYGVFLGGFVVVAMLGALGATVAVQLTPQLSQRWTILIVSVAITTSCLLVLSVLDWFIGPW